jgi:hypothetical protein
MIKTHPSEEYKCSQPKAEYAPRCPVRALICAPSYSGKTVFLISAMLDVYRGCFQRIFVFSPTVFVDPQWRALFDYQRKWLHVEDDEKLYFDVFSDADLNKVIETQAKIVNLAKERGYHRIPQIAIILDDFIDDPACKNYRSISTLFTRSRHYFINTWVSTQKLRAMSPVWRANATCLIFFRLRNQHEKAQLIEEYGAVYDPKTIEELYNHATAEPFQFFYINLLAKKPEEMFYKNFTTRLNLDVEEK